MEKNAKDEITKQEKCFVMMPISDQGDYPPGHFTKVYEQIIQPAVREAGYEPYRVDENNICDTIINKIFDAIQECPMAICDLSNRNPNVLYELGLRQAYDKPVVLIQDEKTEKIFDVGGISTVFYKSARIYEDVIEARDSIKSAITSTREGKVNSLVRIVKATTPDLSKIDVSKDDVMNAKLDKIFQEIKRINQDESRTYNYIRCKPYQNYSDDKIRDSTAALKTYGDLLINICEQLNTKPLKMKDLHLYFEMVKSIDEEIGFNLDMSDEDSLKFYALIKAIKERIKEMMDIKK